MADQQDQSLSGGSVEKASAPADASKQEGKSISEAISGGNSGYRKRQSSGETQGTTEEKRRRQTIDNSQTTLQSHTLRKSLDSSKGEGARNKAERRNQHVAGLGPPIGWS